MRPLPLADPGTPDARSPARYLWWVARGQLPTIVMGVTFGTIWMVAQSVMPAIIGEAIDDGVTDNDMSQLWMWAMILLVVGVVQAAAGIVRHRFAVSNWLIAAYRTVQVVSRHTVRLGATLPRRVSTGEVISIGSSDLAHVGNAIEVMGRAGGALVSFVVVALILLHTSVTLGLVVLIGMPTLLLVLAPMLKPLQKRNMAQREMMGHLNSLASDIVGGLRVLRGIGGEEVFHRRYYLESQKVRAAGVEVGRLQSLLDALQVFLPGLFVVIVVWLGARFAVEGEISPGQLVAFYGYSAFLMLPLRTATEAANKVIRGLVAGQRICRVLSVEPEVQDVAGAGVASTNADLVDVQSGLVVKPGLLTAVVADRPDESAALADRLGRFAEGPVLLDGVSLSQLDRRFVRRSIVVSDANATLFSGRLRDELDPHGDAHRRGDHGRGADGLGRGRARAARRRARRRRRGARPVFLGWAAPAARAQPRPHDRPRRPGAGRADLRGRRPHRGHHRAPAPAAPGRPHHRDHDGQPADARQRRRGRPAAPTVGSSPPGGTATCSTTRATAAS